MGLLTASVTSAAETWDLHDTSQELTNNKDGPVVLSAGNATLKILAGDGRFSTTANYRCLFKDSDGNEKSTPAIVDDDDEMRCGALQWGAEYDAGIVELLVQKKVGEEWVKLEMTKGAQEATLFQLYLEEDVFSVQPTRINAYNQTVTIAGSGFSAKRDYFCVTFPQGSGVTSQGFTNLRKFPFERINRTMGTCTINTDDEAKFTMLSLANVKAVMQSLNVPLDQELQPIVKKILWKDTDAEYHWKGLEVKWFESWTRTSTLFGGIQGKDNVDIVGAGFIKERSYICTYTYNKNNNSCGDREPDVDYTLSVSAKWVDSQTLSCETPAWTFNQSLASTVVNVNVIEGDVIQGEIPYNNVKQTTFDFLEKPTWSEDTVQENTVFVEGVHCASLNLTFKALGGRSPLRLTLDYTPMRPQASYDFLQWDDKVPTHTDVRFKTDNVRTSAFMDALKVDEIFEYGYCLKQSEYTLTLPTFQPKKATTASYVYYDKSSQEFQKTSDMLGIQENTVQPSHLTLKTVSSGDEVLGTLFWNVSRGWEGYGYYICIVARHALVRATIETSGYFAKRCFYVIVPKCRKCYGPKDNLASIAKAYGASWLDLWSINTQLSFTTAVKLSSDEVFNAQGDAVYPKIGIRQEIRLGLAYKMLPTDTVQSVSTRFGMSLSNLMQLNPDIVAAYQVLAAYAWFGRMRAFVSVFMLSQSRSVVLL